MVCTVLPSPISSARMVSVPWAQEKRSQLRPSSWYGCSVPPVASMYHGCLSNLMVGCGGRGRETHAKPGPPEPPASNPQGQSLPPATLLPCLSFLRLYSPVGAQPACLFLQEALPDSQPGLGVPTVSARGGPGLLSHLGSFPNIGLSNFKPRLRSLHWSCSTPRT